MEAGACNCGSEVRGRGPFLCLAASTVRIRILPAGAPPCQGITDAFEKLVAGRREQARNLKGDTAEAEASLRLGSPRSSAESPCAPWASWPRRATFGCARSRAAQSTAFTGRRGRSEHSFSFARLTLTSLFRLGRRCSPSVWIWSARLRA